jgi:hypothetical protein
MRKQLFLWGLIVYTLAIWSRYRYFDAVEIYSDSLSPYLAATKVIHTGFSDPPNPESDHWLWITALPQVLVAKSLQELFFLRLCISALVAPFGLWATWKLCKDQGIKDGLRIGVVVGTILSFDVGLIDTFLSSFRGYMAPEWIGLSFLLFLYSSQRKWLYGLSLLCIPIAAGHHPLTLGLVLCVLVYVKKKGDIPMVIGILLLGFLGRIFWVWEIMKCDAGGIACITEIASGSSEQISYMDIVQRIWKDRILGELGWLGMFYLLGLCIPFFRRRITSIDMWIWLSCIGILILGLSLSTLRPYHMRIVAVPMIVIAVVHMNRICKYGYVFVGFMWICTTPKTIPIDISNHVGMTFHDEQGSLLLQRKTMFWLEGTIESELKCSSSGVVLSAYLQGLSVNLLPSEPKGDLLVFDCKKVKYKGSLLHVEDWKDDIVFEELIGAFDWVRAFHRDEDIRLKW